MTLGKNKRQIIQFFGLLLIVGTFFVMTPKNSQAAGSPDLNSDGCVNNLDYQAFTGYFASKNAAGDINADTKVDAKDLAVIMKNWQTSCAAQEASTLKHIWQGDLGSLGASKITFMAQHFDVVITKIDNCSSGAQANIASLKSQAATAGRSITVLQYFKFAGTHTSESPVDSVCQAPPFAPSFLSQNLMWMSPDGTPYGDATNHWYYAALQDPAKRAAYINLVIPYLKDQLANYQIDGFFFDNGMLLGSSETSHLVSGSYVVGRPADYNAQALWDGKYNVVSTLRQDSVLSHTKIYINNFWNKPYIPGNPNNDPNNAFQQIMDRLQFYQVANGILRERPFWQEQNGFPECYDKMEISLDNLAGVTKSMGDIVLYAYGTDTIGRIYSAASALTVNHGNVMYLAGPLGGNNYFPEYDLDLGAPISNTSNPQNDLYVRDFANGKTVVYAKANSCGTTSSTTYTIGSGYEMLTGFTGTGTFTDVGTMTWAPAPTTITLDSTHPAYILRKP